MCARIQGGNQGCKTRRAEGKRNGGGNESYAADPHGEVLTVEKTADEGMIVRKGMLRKGSEIG
eukprot:767725-Hanusia_phi.AAC.2